MTADDREAELLIEVRGRLSKHEYMPLADPFHIGSVGIQGLDAWLGPVSSPDLVVVFPVDDQIAGLDRPQRAMQQIARALDAIGSTRGITAILVRSQISRPISVDMLLELGRVVVTSGSEDLDRQLAPLVPFIPPDVSLDTQVTSSQVDLIPKRAPNDDKKALSNVLASTTSGPKAVEAALERWLDDAFSLDEGESDV